MYIYIMNKWNDVSGTTIVKFCKQNFNIEFKKVKIDSLTNE